MKILAVAAGALAVLARGAQAETNHWRNTECSTLNLKPGSNPLESTMKSKTVEGRIACIHVVAPEYYHTKVVVVAKKVSKVTSDCSRDMILLKEGMDFSGKTLGTICKKRKKIVETIDTSVNDGRVSTFYMYSDDRKADKAVLKATALPCLPGDGCPIAPTASPTVSPTDAPSVTPTTAPTNSPSTTPTASPSTTPTVSPTDAPSVTPTTAPTNSPSTTPTASPSTTPTVSPTNAPSVSPTASPSASPSTSPTKHPSTTPTVSPTAHPSTTPTASPTASPTPPTAAPTTSPTVPCGTFEASMETQGTFTLEEIENIVPSCWRFELAPDAPQDAFVSLVVDINFAESPEGCSRYSLNLFDGVSDSGDEISGPICTGQGLVYDTPGRSVFARLLSVAGAFGPGFTIRYQGLPSSARIEPTVCADQACLQQTLESNAPNGAPRFFASNEPSAATSEDETLLIELDADVMVLDAPIVVPEGTSAIIRPKAPRPHVTLDGARRVQMLLAAAGSKVKINNIRFVNGLAEDGRGGAIVSSGDLVAESCSFADNVADAGGGAIYLDGEDGGGFSRFSNCDFHNNVAVTGPGGAVMVRDSQVALVSSLFSGNEVEEGGKGSVADVRNGLLVLSSNNQYAGNAGGDMFFARGSRFLVESA